MLSRKIPLETAPRHVTPITTVTARVPSLNHVTKVDATADAMTMAEC
jgi:hypothetical protein